MIKGDSWTVLVGDCRDRLKDLPDDSVDSIVTDPPYELGFMGKKWDNSGIAYDQAVWLECLRVLKPGGHILAFGGTRTFHRMAVAIEDAGFEIRDSIAWLYGSGFPKSHNLKDEWDGWGTALKPAFEPVIMGRKPLSEKTVAGNVLKHGTGAINVDGTRIPDKDGRWPANIILDEYTATLVDEQSGVTKSSSSKMLIPDIRSGAYGSEYGTRDDLDGTLRGFNDAGGASRFFYVSKTSKKDRNEGLEHVTPRFAPTMGNGIGGKEHDPETATPKANHHPTVKPTDLMAYLIKLVTPAGGTVLDPFTGSGSTGKAALLNGYKFVGVELTEEYLPIIEGRLQHAELKYETTIGNELT